MQFEYEHDSSKIKILWLKQKTVILFIMIMFHPSGWRQGVLCLCIKFRYEVCAIYEYIIE
jgi:hypothetical protein